MENGSFCWTDRKYIPITGDYWFEFRVVSSFHALY